MANDNLRKAKKQKNDEFYTQFNDIQNELKYYQKHFEGKTVFCNCDGSSPKRGVKLKILL